MKWEELIGTTAKKDYMEDDLYDKRKFVLLLVQEQNTDYYFG